MSHIKLQQKPTDPDTFYLSDGFDTMILTRGQLKKIKTAIDSGLNSYVLSEDSGDTIIDFDKEDSGDMYITRSVRDSDIVLEMLLLDGDDETQILLGLINDQTCS